MKNLREALGVLIEGTIIGYITALLFLRLVFPEYFNWPESLLLGAFISIVVFGMLAVLLVIVLVIGSVIEAAYRKTKEKRHARYIANQVHGRSGSKSAVKR